MKVLLNYFDEVIYNHIGEPLSTKHMDALAGFNAEASELRSQSKENELIIENLCSYLDIIQYEISRKSFIYGYYCAVKGLPAKRKTKKVQVRIKSRKNKKCLRRQVFEKA